ncbi:MAG: glycosyltransferase [Nitrospirae bacterium]|nr:glycosyltransferase [Nitrospirota bacterium]
MLKSAYAITAIKLFETQRFIEPKIWPALSIIIPACNEGITINQSLSTILAQDYPDMEIILINDRSTDNTGVIIHEMALIDPRIKAVDITNLPDGWLGKVNALSVGTKAASGKWLLFTDADVNFENGVLKKAIAIAINENCQHLTLSPHIKFNSFILELAVQTFGILLVSAMKAETIGRPKSKAFIGIGAFNLIEKTFFDTTEGFEWLRMEVCDDLGLGLLVQRHNGKTFFAFSNNDINLTWYDTLWEMVKGLEKNLFAVSLRYSLLRLIPIVVLFWMFSIAPIAGLIYSSNLPYLLPIALGAIFSLFLTSYLSKIKLKTHFSTSFFAPIGFIIISLMMLRSGIMCKIRGGIIWRGTLYEIDKLKAGQRVK